jgi:thioredoxin 1
MATKTVTDDSFQQDVLGSDKPVLVDFWAEWCGPCKRIAPTLEQLSDELAGKVTIAKLNIEESPEAPMKYGVRAIPTMILFKDGEVAATQIGGNFLKSQLQAWIEGAIGAGQDVSSSSAA